jgi:hypothetical protein
MDKIKINGKRSTKKSPQKAQAPTDQWRNVTATQARGKGSSPSSHLLASGIYLQKLVTTWQLWKLVKKLRTWWVAFWAV